MGLRHLASQPLPESHTMQKLALTTLLASALFASAGASAQALQLSTYLGAAGGVANWNVDCGGTSSCKKNPATVRAYGGYNVTPNVAVELTYASLGTVKASNSNTGDSVNLKGSSFDVSGLYKFSSASNPFGAFVKGGLAYTRASASATVNGVSGSDNKKAWGLLVGAGATYALSENLALRAEIDTQKVKVPGSSGNVTSFVVGGQGSF